jgi:hypothetical protein
MKSGPSHWRTRARSAPGFLSGLVLCAAPVLAEGTAGSLLALEEVPDGRCQILSEGGKLVLLRNLDPARTVRFRLVRRFTDVPQGRLDGALAAGDAPLKLGCSRVDGRVQSWSVERASFAEDRP